MRDAIALVVGLAASSAQVGAGSGPKGSPAACFGPDAYPAAAQRRGAQGRTVARLDLDAAGRVVGCTIVTSSGDPDLDAGTCRIALVRGQFTPAMDSAGQPVASAYTLPVRWVLPDEQDATPPSDRTTASSVPTRREPVTLGSPLLNLVGLGAVVLLALGGVVGLIGLGLALRARRRESDDRVGDQPFVREGRGR